jgi:hypothetical protein
MLSGYKNSGYKALFKVKIVLKKRKKGKSKPCGREII